MTRQKQELPRIGSDTFVDFHGHRELLDACIVGTLADELDDTAVRTEPLVKMTDVLVDLPEQRFVSGGALLFNGHCATRLASRNSRAQPTRSSRKPGRVRKERGRN